MIFPVSHFSVLLILVFLVSMREIVRLSCSEFPEPDFVTALLASLQFTLDSNQLLGVLKSLYSGYFVNIIYLPLWVFHSSTQSDNGINPGKETSWKKSFKYPWQPCSARQFVYIDFIRTQTKNYGRKKSILNCSVHSSQYSVFEQYLPASQID